jgi:hypothetical protein
VINSPAIDKKHRMSPSAVRKRLRRLTTMSAPHTASKARTQKAMFIPILFLAFVFT